MSDIAIIHTGGKQYKVSTGDTVKIEKLTGEYKVGDKVVFDKVLLSGNDKKAEIGAPYLEGKKIDAVISEIGREKKIDVLKYKQKSRYYKMRGHKQPFMKVKISQV